MAGKVRLGMVEQEEGEEDHWDPGQFAMDSKVHTSIRQSTNRQLEGTSKSRDRSDRATVETVLAPRPRMVPPPPPTALTYWTFAPAWYPSPPLALASCWRS